MIFSEEWNKRKGFECSEHGVAWIWKCLECSKKADEYGAAKPPPTLSINVSEVVKTKDHFCQ